MKTLGGEQWKTTEHVLCVELKHIYNIPWSRSNDFIDEVEHNDFITSELLKYLRDSKFVVVDLSHQNNGAYFEEGYAMGLEKPVIQLCKKDVRLKDNLTSKSY